MLKQLVSGIKTIPSILLAVLFAVPLASVAISTANNTNINAILQNDGSHILDLDFVAREGAHVIYKYIGDYNKNYTQHVEYILKGTHLIEDIRIAPGVDYDNVTVNGKRAALDSPEAYDRDIVYSDADIYQEEIAEAKWAADLNNTYEKDIITQEKHFELIRRTKLLGILKGLLYIV